MTNEVENTTPATDIIGTEPGGTEPGGTEPSGFDWSQVKEEEPAGCVLSIGTDEEREAIATEVAIAVMRVLQNNDQVLEIGIREDCYMEFAPFIYRAQLPQPATEDVEATENRNKMQQLYSQVIGQTKISPIPMDRLREAIAKGVPELNASISMVTKNQLEVQYLEQWADSLGLLKTLEARRCQFNPTPQEIRLLYLFDAYLECRQKNPSKGGVLLAGVGGMAR